jgi:hypothetical protein
MRGGVFSNAAMSKAGSPVGEEAGTKAERCALELGFGVAQRKYPRTVIRSHRMIEDLGVASNPLFW